MIKFVVAKHDEEIYSEYLKPCLTERVGVEIEDGNSMFEKYNKGIDHWKEVGFDDDDIICFCHEDVKILDKDFDAKVEMVFNLKPKIGILGVIGTTSFSEQSGWWLTDRIRYGRGHLIQGLPDKKPYHMIDRIGFFDDLVSVDGCIFFMKGKLAKDYIFDEKTYNGYHFYDVDSCLTSLEKGWDIAVADILIEHKSEGPLPPSWQENKIKFLKKWRDKGYTFPITKDKIKI